jgi:prevent-host-death family protein
VPEFLATLLRSYDGWTKFNKLSLNRQPMRTVNIHQAKTHLSRLVDQAAKGEPFVIAKAGKPLVKVVALDAPSSEQVRRLGFLAGQFTVPDDFDRMGAAEIKKMFENKE